MKKLSILCLALCVLLLCACGQKRVEVEYTQKLLREPERIEVTAGSNTIVYETGSEKYEKIFHALSPNWWMTAQDTPDTAADEALAAAADPDALKTTSNRRYATISDTFVSFLYEESPIGWVQSEADMLEIQKITFVMPPVTESEDNVKGFFLIYQTDDIGYNEGLYTYYYPAEIAGGFWDFLVH